MTHEAGSRKELTTQRPHVDGSEGRGTESGGWKGQSSHLWRQSLIGIRICYESAP